ncbi:zinc-binding dehydrogenase [Chryseobacterium indoltheticum]|uniref:zinc-binding dehydrogenase n=1 Tax=Chryseobacterium indoltheticum TaxID=254 RepID=UPI003F493A5B
MIKLELAKKLGADLVVNAKNTDPGEYLHKEVGGMHGALIAAVSPIAFKQGIDVLREKRNYCFKRSSSWFV